MAKFMKRCTIKDFLSLRVAKGAKLLLGLSGGPDSMALLHLLLECQEELDFSLHIAHVDHGWREESGQEAHALKELAQQLKLPFYVKTLDDMAGADLENRCRQERLAFFLKLHQEHQFQALLLGHHEGDQAETVLKRLFEGAGLQALGGLQLERQWGELPIWRPLLVFTKEELMRYLDKKHVPYFDDETNSDSRYLRSRMRTEIFPELERLFGKSIQKNCIRIGSLCEEVSTYFAKKSETIEKQCVEGPFGMYLNTGNMDPLELKYFLKQYAQGAQLSYDALQLIARLVQQKIGVRRVHAPPLTFHISREYLFVLKKPFPNFFEDMQQWNTVAQGNWQGFWQGNVATPKGEYQVEQLMQVAPKLRKKLKEWYSKHRVPAFFHERAPVFLNKGSVVAECLTGEPLNI